MISSKDLLEILQDDGAQQVGKSNVSQLFKNDSVLGQVGNLEPHWPRFLQTLIS